MRIPLDDQAACARREVALRRRVYPRRVAQGTMTQAQADEQIATMQAIAETLETLMQPNLFDAPMTLDLDPEVRGGVSYAS